MGVYDECVDIRYPVKGQYCLPEIKLIPPAGRDYSFKRTEDFDDFGQNHAWKTILGVSLWAQLGFKFWGVTAHPTKLY